MAKKQANRTIELLYGIHEEIRHFIKNGVNDIACEKLVLCQKFAIELGNLIEEAEGEGFVTVSYLETYCEVVFKQHEAITAVEGINSESIKRDLDVALDTIAKSLDEDIKVRMEMLLLPYKASMWDSLESVWKEAHADEDCDAYVIPIPYFDRNPDGSAKEAHYEAELFPNYVPITHYEKYDYINRKPDAIFIHNPYDGANLVTSVHPFFYSDNLKKFTDCLVYIPYFASAGGMSEAASLCPVYLNADYIVIQSEKYRKYYDKSIPDEKFLAFGSPKFDSVIHKCQNPPEPPAEWKARMTKADGSKKKVYFYNTSIGGMLADTDAFLKKMAYVFEAFEGSDDVCILWRPHPLLDATFDSMRVAFKPRYEELKRHFIESGLGIYDNTPCMEDAIALSDAYIGDASTSVTSFFGIAGKPMFILDNQIHALPNGDDWKGIVYQTPFQTPDGVHHNKYCVTQGNKLYYSPNDDMHYEYFCDLSEYTGGGYYSRAFDYGEKIFVFPNNAQHILVISQDKTIRKIELEREVEQGCVFASFRVYGEYAFLLPNRYLALVRLDMRTEEVMYLPGVSEFNIAVQADDERILATSWMWCGNLYMMNQTGTQLLQIDMETLQTSIRQIDVHRLITVAGFRDIDSEECWLLPYEGTIVTRFNMVTGETKDYDLAVEGLTAIHRRYKAECNQRIFGSMAFVDDEIIFAPFWGNKFVKLNPDTGEKVEWESPFDSSAEDISPYMPNWEIGEFVYDIINPANYQFVLSSERKLYNIDLATKKLREVDMRFQKDEVYLHADGYGKESQWLQYCCVENVFNSIKDELDGTIHGQAFDRQKQIVDYEQVNASPSGDCGKKIYQYVSRA